MSGRTGRRLGAMAAALALGAGAVGCEQSAEDRRADYCEAVDERGEELTRLSDEGDPGAFVEAMPVLEELGDRAPSDLRDEWQAFLNALRGLRDALEETGVEPGDVTADGLPEGLAPEDRRRIRGAASVLASAEVTEATQGIEQHALDVCGTPLF